jgi:hypothetical protein
MTDQEIKTKTNKFLRRHYKKFCNRLLSNPSSKIANAKFVEETQKALDYFDKEKREADKNIRLFLETMVQVETLTIGDKK